MTSYTITATCDECGTLNPDDVDFTIETTYGRKIEYDNTLLTANCLRCGVRECTIEMEVTE